MFQIYLVLAARYLNIENAKIVRNARWGISSSTGAGGLMPTIDDKKIAPDGTARSRFDCLGLKS